MNSEEKTRLNTCFDFIELVNGLRSINLDVNMDVLDRYEIVSLVSKETLVELLTYREFTGACKAIFRCAWSEGRRDPKTGIPVGPSPNGSLRNK